MSDDLTIAGLVRIAEALERIAAVLEFLAVPTAPAPCDHPMDVREDLSTMGHGRFRCGRCQAIVEYAM